MSIKSTHRHPGIAQVGWRGSDIRGPLVCRRLAENSIRSRLALRLAGMTVEREFTEAPDMPIAASPIQILLDSFHSIPRVMNQ